VSIFIFFFFSSRRRHTRSKRDWSSDVCSSDLNQKKNLGVASLSETASYLNEHNQVKAVEKLETKTTLAAEVTSDKYGVKGDDGRSEERRVGKECGGRRGRAE